MREMKDSGVEWIGETPQNWKQSKVKYLMSLTNGRAYKQQELLAKGTYRVLRVGNFNTNDKWYYSDLELPEKQYCEKGDLLYLWATTFGPAFWNEEKVIYHYHIWKVDQFRDYLQRYAFYTLSANAEWQRMQSHGSTMVHVTKEGVENTVFPVPPLSEQRRIVSYLDERCAAIDADIDKRHEVIEKLKEYRESLIAHAVTKGLDPNTEMKDSGVEWFGKVPTTWEILRIGSLFQQKRVLIDDATEDELLSVSEYYGVDYRKKHIKESDTLVRAESLRGYQQCKRNDLIMNIMLAWKGAQAVSEYDGVISPSYGVFSPKGSICPRYFHYLFRTNLYRTYFKSFSTGIMDSRLRLYPEVFLKLSAIVPPIADRESIVAFLDERCAAIDGAISRQEQLIEKLGEYRKSIIHYAVTGKIDCTEA